MAEYVLTATKSNTRPGSFYDRIERVYDLTFKLNGYGRSLDQYFETYPLPVFPDARILDAGCGTGTLTLALLRTLKVPVKLTALDLSASSMATAKKYVDKNNRHQQSLEFTQGNILALPFADEAFDLVVISGVLEYVALDEGLSELARVISHGGYLLHLPMYPSLSQHFLRCFFDLRRIRRARLPRRPTDISRLPATIASHLFTLSAGASQRYSHKKFSCSDSARVFSAQPLRALRLCGECLSLRLCAFA